MTAKLSSGWRRVRLGDVLEQVNRFERVEPDREYRLLGVKWYAKGCHLHTTIEGRELKTKALSVARAGDVTYNKMWTSKGAFGVIQPEQDGYAATSEYPLFVVRNGEVEPGFLGFVFSRATFWQKARALCKGTTQRARLNPNDFLRLDFDLPSLDTQRKTLTTLCAIDNTIHSNEDVFARTAALKKSLAHELLTRGLPGRHARFKQSPVGPMPTDWKISTLGTEAEVVRGASPRPAGDPRYFGGSIPWITVGELTKDSWPFLQDVSSYVTPAGRECSRWIEPGTLLLSNSGATLGVPKITSIGGCINDGSVAFLNITPRVDQLFTYYWLFSLTEHFRTKKGRGLGQPNLNTGIVKETPLPLPPIDEQQSIGRVLFEIDCDMQEMRAFLQQLIKARETLVDLFLTGNVRGSN